MPELRDAFHLQLKGTNHPKGKYIPKIKNNLIKLTSWTHSKERTETPERCHAYHAIISNTNTA